MRTCKIYNPGLEITAVIPLNHSLIPFCHLAFLRSLGALTLNFLLILLRFGKASTPSIRNPASGPLYTHFGTLYSVPV